jgi:hypothetical protein
MKGVPLVKKLLLLFLVAFVAFAVLSCGENTDTAVNETETETEVADAGDVQVTQCDGNVCTHEAGSTRECAVEGKCPHMEQAKIAKAGVGCPYAKECAEAGKCTGKCGGACKGECECDYCKHVCTEACGDGCPHAKTAGAGCATVKDATKADGCGGCPRAKTCKSGS